VLVIEQRHYLRFHNAVNSGRTCIYFAESYLKSMSSAHCRQSFFEKFRILKMNITRAIEEVNERTLRNVEGTW
jgi:hypothetical protein